jgi:hypothetical protein
VGAVADCRAVRAEAVTGWAADKQMEARRPSAYPFENLLTESVLLHAGRRVGRRAGETAEGAAADRPAVIDLR